MNVLTACTWAWKGNANRVRGVLTELKASNRHVNNVPPVEPPSNLELPALRNARCQSAFQVIKCHLLNNHMYNISVLLIHLTASDNVFAGTYLNATQNSCISCKKGTYQPATQQTNCLPCPPNMSTKTMAAVSILY